MGPTAVCVLGFHRSGTSMATRLLNLLGVELGGDLLPPDVDNPRGFWEPRWMVRLNDEILAAVDASYMRPPALDAPWGDLRELRERAGALLDGNLSGAPLFGFKDPRLCLTWPFWKDLVAERAGEIRYVLCLRSPAETAASMVRRDRYPGVAHEDWGDLWLDYTGRALAATRGAPRLLVFYDDLVRGGAAEARRLADHVGADWPEAELEAAIDAGMRHHAASLTQTAADERLPAAARAAYVSLRAAATAGRELAACLERTAEDLWRARRAEHERAGVDSVHRVALVEAVGELQRGEVREDLLKAELVSSREQLLSLTAELADVRAERRRSLSRA
jgi:O-antigen biosynthesis protein